MANNQGNGRAQQPNIVSYRECQRNYSAILGNYNFDGCREFLKAGVEGTLTSFLCANCGCHRNYHRREEVPPQQAQPPPPQRQAAFARQNHPIPAPAAQQQQEEGEDLDYLDEGENPNIPPVADPEEGQDINNAPERQQPAAVVERRRGRPRVSEVQRQALVSYAQRSNWSLEGRDEEEIGEFCSEVGITSRFLNDWMKRNRRKYGGQW